MPVNKDKIKDHLRQMHDINLGRKWFKKLSQKEPKTPDEEQTMTEIVFQTDLIISEYHKKATNNEK